MAERKKKARIPKPKAAVVARLVSEEEENRGHKICGAWRSTAGKVCCAYPRKNKNRCGDHGGLSLSGVASPSYKGKGYSKCLPVRYRGGHNDLIGNPDLVSLNGDIVFAHQRVQELIESMDVEGSLAHWKALQEMIAIVIALKKKDGEETVPVVFLERVSDKLSEGIADYMKWRDIQQAQNHKRDLLLADARLNKDNQTVITFEQWDVYIDNVVEILDTEIDDRRLLDKIQRQLIPAVAE